MRVSRLGVVGCGEVGVGLIARAAACGVEVVAVRARSGGDMGPVRDAVARALALVRGGTRAARGGVRRAALSPAAREAAMARVLAAPALDALAHCDLAVEACHEALDDKRAVLAAAESCLLPRAILASHTRALPPAGLATELLRPCRFVAVRVLGEPLTAGELELETTDRTRAAVLEAARGFFARLSLACRHTGDEPCDLPLPRRLAAASAPAACPAPSAERESVI